LAHAPTPLCKKFHRQCTAANLTMMMASTPSHFIVLLAALSSSSAHTAATIGVQVGEKGQMIMRQESSKEKSAEVPAAAALAEVSEEDGRPTKKDRQNAAEAFETPSKIDDSLLGNWSPRMPAFVEEYPWFYAATFVGGAFAFMFLVCFYVQYEDSKDQERRLAEKKVAMRRNAASAAMGVPRTGASYVPASPAIRTAAEAVVHAASRPQQTMRDQMAAAPKAKAAAAARAEKETAATAAPAVKDGMSIEKITNAVGNFTGMLAGENVAGSTASGASTPNSQPSSQHSFAHSGYSRQSKNSSICNGSVLVARVNEVIFASSSSWQEIGTLAAGQQVIAAGPPEVADAYTMVPVKPRGAVDLKTLVVQEY